MQQKRQNNLINIENIHRWTANMATVIMIPNFELFMGNLHGPYRLGH